MPLFSMRLQIECENSSIKPFIDYWNRMRMSLGSIKIHQSFINAIELVIFKVRAWQIFPMDSLNGIAHKSLQPSTAWTWARRKGPQRWAIPRYRNGHAVAIKRNMQLILLSIIHNFLISYREGKWCSALSCTHRHRVFSVYASLEE